jgi:hypothetical protein
MPIFRGRHTVRFDGDFVVFLIGMRPGRLWRPDKWLPVAGAMGPMLRELEQQKERGLLAYQAAFMFGGPAVVQYWRSFDDLAAYARDPEAHHLPAWKRFNRTVRDSGEAGIWHETYKVHAGEYEAIYGNMPRVGLAKAGEHAPVGSTAATAARRIGARPDDEPPIPGY